MGSSFMRRRKGPRYYKAKPKERLYYLSGMPPRFWKDYDLRFSSFTCDRQHGGIYKGIEHEQKQFFKDLIKAIKSRHITSHLVGIGSTPTDDHAMIMATKIAKVAIAAKYDVEYVDLGYYERSNRPEPVEAPDVLVIHNLIAEAEPTRLTAARDWINWGEDTLRLVVIAGSDPVSFFDTRLRRQFDAVLYSEAITRKSGRIRRT
jgi:hypothetical protein